MEKADLKVLPLAAVGLALGVAEYFIKPVAVGALRKLGELASKPMETHVHPASIQYYTTGESND